MESEDLPAGMRSPAKSGLPPLGSGLEPQDGTAIAARPSHRRIGSADSARCSSAGLQGGRAERASFSAAQDSTQHQHTVQTRLPLRLPDTICGCLSSGVPTQQQHEQRLLQGVQVSGLVSIASPDSLAAILSSPERGCVCRSGMSKAGSNPLNKGTPRRVASLSSLLEAKCREMGGDLPIYRCASYTCSSHLSTTASST